MKLSTQRGLDRYAKYRVRTGGFLHAVLTNNLMEAMRHADSENRENIVEICQYVYDNLPVACYGSEDAVKVWLAGRHKV